MRRSVLALTVDASLGSGSAAEGGSLDILVLEPRSATSPVGGAMAAAFLNLLGFTMTIPITQKLSLWTECSLQWACQLAGTTLR